MSRRVLVVVLSLYGALVAPAAAWTEPPTDRPLITTRVVDSVRIAEAVWGQVPDCNLQVFEATPDEMTAFTGDPAAGVTYLGTHGPDCPVWLSSIYAAASIDNRIDACDVLVHELGHVLGYGHDMNPLSVMNPGAEVTVWACYERFIGHGARAWRESHPGSSWAVLP